MTILLYGLIWFITWGFMCCKLDLLSDYVDGETFKRWILLEDHQVIGLPPSEGIKSVETLVSSHKRIVTIEKLWPHSTLCDFLSHLVISHTYSYHFTIHCDMIQAKWPWSEAKSRNQSDFRHSNPHTLKKITTFLHNLLTLRYFCSRGNLMNTLGYDILYCSLGVY
jgi:hypothetical protein